MDLRGVRWHHFLTNCGVKKKYLEECSMRNAKTHTRKIIKRKMSNTKRVDYYFIVGLKNLIWQGSKLEHMRSNDIVC